MEHPVTTFPAFILRLTDESKHLRTATQHAGKAEFFIESAFEIAVDSTEFGTFGGSFGNRAELFEIERLLQIIERTELHRFDGNFDRIVCRYDNDFGFVGFLLHGVPAKTQANKKILLPSAVCNLPSFIAPSFSRLAAITSA
jgi:hypothetical protein